MAIPEKDHVDALHPLSETHRPVYLFCYCQARNHRAQFSTIVLGFSGTLVLFWVEFTGDCFYRRNQI